MRIGSLFSGIGGLDLGLERAGVGLPAFQVEANAFCRSILARHWPRTPRFHDVRSVSARTLPPCDVLAGGFPCQDLSDCAQARGGGLDGERSGLWSEYARLVDEVRPRWVVVENVDGAARRRWLPAVRRDLWRLGYASVSLRVRAADVGAPFLGARIFVLAAPADGDGQPARALDAAVALLPRATARARRDWGQPPSECLGVADGVSAPMGRARLRAYGNAVVPACAEAVGYVLLGIEAHR